MKRLRLALARWFPRFAKPLAGRYHTSRPLPRPPDQYPAGGPWG